MAADPLRKFQTWLRQARSAGNELAESVALATADRRGRPSVRYVLLKSVGSDGFVFYTNARSRKGRELEVNAQAALAVYWHETGKQARAEGRVVRVSDREADEYWVTRPWLSRVAAAASHQSRPLASRRGLVAEFRRLEREYRDRDIPRPRHWTGYRLIPREIEFWTREEPRLHRRELFVRRSGRWSRRLLQP